MAKETWVIFDPETGLYLTGYTGVGEAGIWGNEEDAITFETEEDAQHICDDIGKGGIRPTLMPHH